MSAGDVLLNLEAQIKAILAAILNDAAQPLFGSPARIASDGDVLDTTTMPVAAMTLGEERSGPINATRNDHFLPWKVQVYFDSKADGTTLRQKHVRMYGRVLDAVMAGHTLGGFAATTDYRGGGSALVPEDTEQSPERWSCTLQFETHYRTLLLDSGQAA